MKKLKKCQTGGKISTQGYKKDSADRHEPFLNIPSGNITMKGVPHPVIGTDNFGFTKYMLPGNEYYFPGHTVTEIPVKNKMQSGGIPKQFIQRNRQEIPTRQYIPPIEGPGFTDQIVGSGKPWENKPMYLPQGQQTQEIVKSASPRRSAINKVGMIARNPMTALQYKMQGQDIPDYLEYGDRNKFDNAIDVLNPLTYTDAAGRTLTVQHFRDSNQSFGEALGRTALDVGMLYGVARDYRPSTTSIKNPLGDKLSYIDAYDQIVAHDPVGSNQFIKSKFLYKKDLEKSIRIPTLKYRPPMVEDMSTYQPFQGNAFGEPDAAYVEMIDGPQNRLTVPGIHYSQIPQQQSYHQQSSGIPFYLNNVPTIDQQSLPVHKQQYQTQSIPVPVKDNPEVIDNNKGLQIQWLHSHNGQEPVLDSSRQYITSRYNNDSMKLRKMQKGGAASGHSGQFWDGQKWVSSADGATYSNGTFYANGGPVFPVAGAGAMFANGGPTASFYVDGNGRPTPFAMTPGSGQGSGYLQDLPTHMRTGGVTQDGQYIAPFAMWPGSGSGSGYLQDLPTEMKKGGKHKGGKKLTPQQMQMMMQAMQGQGQPGMGAPVGQPPMGMMPPQGPAQGGMMQPQGMQQPMMQIGGRPVIDNVAYAGNKYYDQSPKLPPGSHIDTNYRPNDWGNTEYGQRISYPGDTLTDNQLQDYNNRTYRFLYPDYNQVVQQRGSRPQDKSYYIMSEKDQQKLHNMKRDGPNFFQFLMGEGKQVGHGYLPAPQQQYGGEVDSMKSGGIHIKKSHEGRFTAYKKRTGKTTEEALHSKDPHVRQMANFARNAAKWHHQTGGPVTQGGNMIADNEIYAYGGGYHPLAKFMQDGGPGGASMDLPANNDNSQYAWAPNQSNYDPSTDPNNPANNPGTMPQQGGYATSQGPVYDQVGLPDQYQQSQPNAPVNKQTGNGWGYVGTGMAAIGAGLGIASYLSDKRDARNLRNKQFNDRSTVNQYAAMNQPGGMGDYDQYGAFRPNKNVPTRAGYFPGQMATGGMYHAGQEMEMDDAEIARLKRMGYKIQML